MVDTPYQGSAQQYDVFVAKDEKIPMRDGTILVADVYRPALGGRPVEGQFASIVERTPYGRRGLHLHHTAGYFARRGYVFVLQDVRGRGDSEGDFQYLLNPKDEGTDGYDTVEWMASQPWSDGQVGTAGHSYTGANQHALAVMRPPHLKAQFIMDAGYNYHTRTVRDHGAFNQALFLPYIFRMARMGREAKEDRRIREALEEAYFNLKPWVDRLPLKRGATPLRLVPSYEGWYFDMATRADYDDYWKNPGHNLEEFIDQYPDIPVFLVTSWYGNHPWANVVKFNELRKRLSKPVRMLIAYGTHSIHSLETTWAGNIDFGVDASRCTVNDYRVRWFDYWFKGLNTGILDGAPIEMFVMGGGDGRKNLDGRMNHGGYWRSEHEWPLARTRFTNYYLHADGSLSTDLPGPAEPPRAYSYNPNDPCPTIGGNFQTPLVPGFIEGGAWDQRGRKALYVCKDTLPLAQRSDVLVFETEPLTEDVKVTGPIVVKLWASSSALDTDFTAKLVDVYPPNDDYPEGYAMNLCDGIIRARYRNSRERAELLEPGQVYPLTIEPQPTGNVFKVGHRIRLDISSSSFPQFDVNPNTGEPLGLSRRVVVAHNTVYSDAERPSHVVLPIVPRLDR